MNTVTIVSHIVDKLGILKIKILSTETDCGITEVV
jgi:hypothetical protein